MSYIEVKNLSKIYTEKKIINDEKKIAVNDISFEIEKGEVFGLLGPNGAGKTTTIEMLSTLLTPTAGTIKINNMDIIKEKKQIRKFISFIFGSERGLYWRLTGKENLLYFADLYDIDKKCAKQRINRLLQIVGLEDAKDILVEKYSKGMKQKV